MTISFLIEFFRDGGPVMIPILLISVAIWAIIIERILYFRRNAAGAPDVALNLISAPDSRSLTDRTTVLERYVATAIDRGALLAVDPKDIFAESELAVAAELDARADWLKTLAAAAPLLGLFGTVTGMIETFDALTVQYSGDPRTLSSGVSAALLTTQAGLVAGLPGLIAASMIAHRARRIRSLMVSLRTDAARRISGVRKGGDHVGASASR